MFSAAGAPLTRRAAAARTSAAESSDVPATDITVPASVPASAPRSNRSPPRRNESQVSDEELFPRLQAEAAKQPQPDLHIRGDKEVRYERVAQAMASAQRAGVRKIGFVTDPQ